jgi:hypothetical protein
METTVGQQLKKARETLGLRIEDAAQGTHIKLTYLQELENDHPELLPSPANARGFLRLYASFLKISPQPLIDLWDHPILPEPAPVSNQVKSVSETVQLPKKEESAPVLDSSSKEELADEGEGDKLEKIFPAKDLPQPQSVSVEDKPVKQLQRKKK